MLLPRDDLLVVGRAEGEEARQRVEVEREGAHVVGPERLGGRGRRWGRLQGQPVMRRVVRHVTSFHLHLPSQSDTNKYRST